MDLKKAAEASGEVFSEVVEECVEEGNDQKCEECGSGHAADECQAEGFVTDAEFAGFADGEGDHADDGWYEEVGNDASTRLTAGTRAHKNRQL